MVALLHNLVRHHLHLVVHFVVAAPHEPLDRINRVLWVGNRLPLGYLADQTLARLGERDDRWRGSPSFFVGDHLGLAAFHDRHYRVCSAQVNADNLCH